MTTPTTTPDRRLEVANCDLKRSPREIAQALGVKTADQVSRPASAQPGSSAQQPARVAPEAQPSRDSDQRLRWSREKKLAFTELSPAALALVATDGPVSVTLFGAGGEVQRLGHNRGIWPARIAKTAAWKDTVTATWDKNPFFALGAKFRLWCPTVQERDKLAEFALGLMAERAENDGDGQWQARHGFLDLGPELDLELFKVEIQGIADRIGVMCWDDEGLGLFLDRCVRDAERILRERGGQLSSRMMERVTAKAMGRV